MVVEKERRSSLQILKMESILHMMLLNVSPASTDLARIELRDGPKDCIQEEENFQIKHLTMLGIKLTLMETASLEERKLNAWQNIS